MTRAEFDALCAAHPGAVLSGPGELDAWKVGGKMFAVFGHVDTRDRNTERGSVRCADNETAAILIDAGAAHRAPYIRGAWVSLWFADLAPDEAKHRVAVSYGAVRASLTRKVQATLPPVDGA